MHDCWEFCSWQLRFRAHKCTIYNIITHPQQYTAPVRPVNLSYMKSLSFGYIKPGGFCVQGDGATPSSFQAKQIKLRVSSQNCMVPTFNVNTEWSIWTTVYGQGKLVFESVTFCITYSTGVIQTTLTYGSWAQW